MSTRVCTHMKQESLDLSIFNLTLAFQSVEYIMNHPFNRRNVFLLFYFKVKLEPFETVSFESATPTPKCGDQWKLGKLLFLLFLQISPPIKVSEHN